jgi:BioD-like phosphotransacetylase family protein
MQKVRSEYDHCKTDYQRSMEILYGRKSVETTTPTTTTSTTQSPRFMQITLMKRQQMNSVYVSLETTTTALPVKNVSSDVSDQDKLQIVCW